MEALLIRIASLLLAIVPCHFAGVTPESYRWATYSIGFSHYLLALVYARSPIAAVASDRAWPLVLLGLGMLGIGLYQADFPLFLYFGLHHALNEAWTRRPTAGQAPVTSRMPEFALHLLAYIIVLRHDIGLAGMPLAGAVCALSGCIAICGFRTLRDHASSLRNALNDAAPVIGSVLLVAASQVVPLRFLDVVLYHFLLWAILPVVRLRSVPERSVTAYLALLLLTTAGSVALSPLGPSRLQIPTLIFLEAFLVGSCLHITVSFALSDAHPAWIVRLFRPAARPGASDEFRET